MKQGAEMPVADFFKTGSLLNIVVILIYESKY